VCDEGRQPQAGEVVQNFRIQGEKPWVLNSTVHAVGSLPMLHQKQTLPMSIGDQRNASNQLSATRQIRGDVTTYSARLRYTAFHIRLFVLKYSSKWPAHGPSLASPHVLMHLRTTKYIEGN
jgi:hypothetical protein